MSADMQRQIDDLAARVTAIERGQSPRLGPRPETPEETAARSQRIVDAVKAAVPVNREALCTTNGKPVADVRTSQTNETGQHDGYIVLCPDERAKGFVRPYRDSYRHTTCGTVTTMGRALSETYARDPSFYGATFCVHCNQHLPVAEFVWTADGQQVGS
jgi:hypothetical protein